MEENSVISCPSSEKPCSCDEIYEDFTGFFVRIHLGNLPKLKNVELQEFLRNQIFRTLKEDIPRLKNVIIEKIEFDIAVVDVTLRIYIDKKDGETLKSVFSSWSTRRFISNLTLLDDDINFGPILSSSSVSLSSNKPGIIWMHDDFILSCAARGSSGMRFRWLKDGIYIDTSHSLGRKWNRIIKDPHVDGQYTALLGVIDADSVLDEGVFTCQVEEDFKFQRCVSKRIQIKRAPTIRLDPMSLTVHKGENFTIKCITTEEYKTKQHYTYSWTKNKELLPVKTESSNYEILYPEGSILQINKIEKSTSYSCLIQDGSISNEASIDVLVVGNKVISTCEEEDNFGVLWKKTAPDSTFKQLCPYGYKGIVKRLCSFSSNGSKWLKPDFSDCRKNDLENLYLKFRAYRMGYDTSFGTSKTLDVVKKHLDKPLLPGEGGNILNLLENLLTTMNLTHYRLNDEDGENLLEIIDKIMKEKDSIINETQVKQLQQLIKEMVLVYFSLYVNGTQSIFHKNSTTIDISLTKVNKKSTFSRLPLLKKTYPEWFSYKLEVNVENAPLSDIQPILVSVVYRNLSSFLPRRSSIRLKDGVEIEYVLLSDIVTNLMMDNKNKIELNKLINERITISMEFKHKIKNNSLKEWETKCAVSNYAMYDNSWDITSCNTEKLNDTSTRCFCTKTGTFAVILTNKNQKNFSDKLEIHKFIVTLGCSICFILTTATGLVLLVYWSRNRTCLLFVKLQCCFSISGAMLVFIISLAIPENNQTPSFSMCVMIFLETFLLVASSSQLSKLLVVYTELIQFPKPSSAKMTVIGIITGVPLITVFGNHTAHKAMNIKLKTWWIIGGTLSFHVFMTCFVIIIILYIFVYYIVHNKIQQFLKYQQKHKNFGCFQQRIYLLNRSALIFIFLIITTISSIVYVNYSNDIYCHYEFCIINISLGLVIVLSYVMKKENTSYPDILDKLKIDKSNMIIANSTNKHLTFYTKEDAEAESESTPESTFNTSKTKVRFANDPITTKTTGQDKNSSNLENYNSSPKSFRKNYQDMDCLELDLVISFKQDERCSSSSSSTFSSNKKINLVKPTIAITSSDQDLIIPNRMEKLEFKTFQKTPIIKIQEDNDGDNKNDLDVVLSSISQDLDYLLNQDEDDLRDTLKRKRLKSPKLNNKRDPDAVTDISRTKC